jgi:hypothetical protein
MRSEYDFGFGFGHENLVVDDLRIPNDAEQPQFFGQTRSHILEEDFLEATDPERTGLGGGVAVSVDQLPVTLRLWMTSAKY